MICGQTITGAASNSIPGTVDKYGSGTFDCPIGSYCEEGLEIICPPGHICPEEILADPIECVPGTF